MNRQIRFTDLFGMPDRSNVFSDAANLLEDLYGSSNSPTFRVAIRATHAGYLLNNRVYPGKGVKAGAPTWVSKDNGGTAGYDKPFLKHHESKSEPIGRVDAQKFVQLWDDDKFSNDWKHPDHGTSMGSGYILIGGSISDRDAQQKILDGRYKTVSTGQTSNKARCSICGYDWLNDSKEEEICEHRPGSVYDVDGIKYRAYLVTGKMKYLECSFVNHPANELAGILSADFDSSLVPESREENVEVVTADSMGGLCSIALTDSDGRITELIRSEDKKDELPYGADNIRNSVRVSVPETFKEAKTAQSLTKRLEAIEGISNKKYELEEDSDRDKIKFAFLTENAIKNIDVDKVKETVEKHFNQLLDKFKNDGRESEEAMSDQTKNNEPEVVAEDTQHVKSPDGSDRTLNILETALADSQIRTAELEAELAKAKQLYDTKIGEYNALMDQNASLNEQFKKQLSSQLVTIQLQLQKPHVKSIKDSETFAEAIEKVATRSVESLRDSIEDLVPELASSFKTKGLPSFIKDRTEEKPPIVRSMKEELVVNHKQEQIDPRDQI
jgi:hypothetical protein